MDGSKKSKRYVLHPLYTCRRHVFVDPVAVNKY